MKPQISKWKLILIICLSILVGTAETIFTKFILSEDSLGVSFQNNQFFITATMFIGEASCLIIYFIVKAITDRQKNERRKTQELHRLNNCTNILYKHEEEVLIEQKTQLWYFVIPAMCDLIGSGLLTIGLSYLTTSVFQIVQGGIVIFTSTGSYLFLKAKLYSHHIVGIVMVILGLIIVGLNTMIIDTQHNSSTSLIWTGLALVLVAEIFFATMFISEQVILRNYRTSSLKILGIEGLWGLFAIMIILGISYFIRCETWSQQMKDNICQHNDIGEYRFEDAIFACRQLGNNYVLLIYFIFHIIFICSFNITGLLITAYVSATARTIADASRSFFIWLFFLIMPFVPEDSKESFYILQMMGFIILILGSMIYNEVIVLPFYGLDNHLRKNIPREITEEEQAVVELIEAPLY